MDKLAIINLTLDALGQSAIDAEALAALDDDNARACDDAYDIVRRGLLELFPYSFAVRELTLALAVSVADEDQILGFEFLYDKPASCLAAWGIWNPASKQVDDRIEFKVRGDYVACDLEDAVLVCSYDNTDPATYSMLFCRALALHLAAAVCKPVTGDDKLKQGLLQEAAALLSAAQKSSARQEHRNASAIMGRRYIDL